MKSKSLNLKHLLRWLEFLIIAVLLLLYIVLPVALAVVAVYPTKSQPGLPPPGFEPVTLETGDGFSLAGWYFPPKNSTAIILIHGAGASREAVRPYAEMLARHGYGVLALDLRGHGASGGSTNRLGWQGTRDVGAAVAFLEKRPEVDHIGALGLSLGGEVLLGAASDYSAIRAIAADGATRRSLAELMALPSERPLVRNFTARVMYAAVQLLSGQQPPLPLLDSMTQAGSTEFLLIAAGEDEMEVKFNELFADTFAGRAQLWIALGADHTGAFGLYSDVYEQRVIAFFNNWLR
jgi:pimeloyl-ACP methyl ester carboxylesterase